MSDKKLRTPLLSILYEQYLDAQDSPAFQDKVSRCYTSGSLERLTKHHIREVRRAAVLALGFVGCYESNHVLGCALLDDDRTVRLIAGNGIRSVWTRVGNEAQREQLDAVVNFNAAHRYENAIQKATELIEESPWFAEAWHQRSVAHFNLKQFAESVRDSHEALEINPYHFVAATRMGQAELDLERYGAGWECFRRGRRLNHKREGVRVLEIRLACLGDDK